MNAFPFADAIILAIFALSIASCTTTTETRPDGTVVKTEGIDKDALAAILTAARDESAEVSCVIASSFVKLRPRSRLIPIARK